MKSTLLVLLVYCFCRLSVQPSHSRINYSGDLSSDLMPVMSLLLSQSLVFLGIMRFMDIPGEAKREAPGGAGSGKDLAGDKSDKSEKEKDRDDRLEQDDSSGGDDKEKEDEEDRLFREQRELLKGQFNEIGELLEKRKIKLVLVFDLDGTLYISPEQFKHNLKEMLPPITLHTLQQNWFRELSQFIQRFRMNVVLIYKHFQSLG